MQQIYEQTLVLRGQLGDEAAFAELLTLHGPHLLQFTRNMMQSSPDLVDDLLQEIWLAIYKGLPRLRDVSRFRPWVFRIPHLSGVSPQENAGPTACRRPIERIASYR